MYLFSSILSISLLASSKLSMALCGSLWLSVALCGSLWLPMALCISWVTTPTMISLLALMHSARSFAAGIMAQNQFTEKDWHHERFLTLGPVRVRAWPSASDGVQGQWAAVDVWMSMRGVDLIPSPDERMKARSFTGLFMFSCLKELQPTKDFTFKFCFLCLVSQSLQGRKLNERMSSMVEVHKLIWAQQEPQLLVCIRDKNRERQEACIFFEFHMVAITTNKKCNKHIQ